MGQGDRRGGLHLRQARDHCRRKAGCPPLCGDRPRDRLQVPRHDRAAVAALGGGAPIGVLEVLNKASGRLDEDDVDLLTVVSALSAAAIEQQRAVALLRQREERVVQSQQLDALGQLAGGLAHEFNNLLTVVIGYSERLLAGLASNDPSRAGIEQIKTAGGRAAGLTRELLTFSRRQTVQPVLVDLNRVVEQTERMLYWLAGERIELVLRREPYLRKIKADCGLLKQALLHLATNAKEAMPQGGTLTIETANVELERTAARQREGVQPGLYVVLTVRDTGLGMDAETRAHMFEPFFTTKEAGKGLGLAAVYGIVRQCGGFIEVESAPQEGTTIRLYFPRINQEGEETVSEGAAAIAHPAVSETATILVVDDEPGVRELVRIILEEYGYTVLEAGHGEEALQVCQQYAGSIHLLLSDVIMPGLIGAPLVERVKALRPSVKVLFMSGYTDDVIGDRGMLGPGVLFLQKPFTPQALIEKIHDVLRSRAERGKPGRVLAIIVRLFPWLRRISLPATLRRSPTESLPF
ncbi:MAG: response regulator [Nitrospira sp.]|nr:response regulator [Nitrospira sp.]